jgi:hypothetical protein
MNRANDFWLPLERYWDLDRGDQFSLVSGYNTTTLFRNLQMMFVFVNGR